MTLINRAALVISLVAACFLALRSPVPGKYDPLPTGIGALLAFLAVVGVVTLLVSWSRRRSRAARGVVLAAAYVSTAIAAGMVYSRARVLVADQRTYDHWPPRLADIRATRIDSMAPQLRAEWGVRMAAHVLADSIAPTAGIGLPAEWPLPVDVTLAVEPDGANRLRLWARTRDGITSCMSMQRPGDTTRAGASSAGCPKDARAPAPASFRPPVRTSWVVPAPGEVATDHAWPQYRNTASKSGGVGRGALGASGWRTQVNGPMRASVSVVGDLVLAGTHGTGAITALDRLTGAVRWRHYLPNWIHQDPVSDGRVVVIGFGDNLASFSGRAPSGIAAYDVTTGRHLWTGFDEGSVMTSPVIRDSVIVYGTGAGIIRKRSLATGEVLAESMLPGMVTMAPPASVGDTIVFGLDHDHVCAWLITEFRPLWCRTLPHLRMLGHAAPSILDGSVVVSGAGTLLTPSFSEFRRLPRRLQWKLVRSAVFPTVWDEPSGQVFVSLRLADGSVRWASPLFADPRLVVGHISGTAALHEGFGAIVLPVADTLVGFDLSNGRILWTASGRDSRGPPLIANDRVIVAGRAGVIESRDVRTGAVTCTVRRKVGFDRAGPAVSGELLILANLDGVVEAIPIHELLDCRPAAPGPTSRPDSTTRGN